MLEMKHTTDIDALLQRIERRCAAIGVIGLGYVGLHLAISFAQAGFTVVGFDGDREGGGVLKDGIWAISDVAAGALKGGLATNFRATGDFEQLAEVDVVTICVPTPLGKNKEPDISYIMNAAEQVACRLRRGQLIVLESTTFPGTTEELLLPLFERRGLRAGSDSCLAFSPERIDPGNKHFAIHNTPKVVGGITEQCTHLVSALYSAVVTQVIPVSSPKAAELVKLLENTFRAVNIGLANEFAQIADILEVDIWEVIQPPTTNPYGLMPFYPRPYLGGHCIPITPLHSPWTLRSPAYPAHHFYLQ